MAAWPGVKESALDSHGLGLWLCRSPNEGANKGLNEKADAVPCGELRKHKLSLLSSDNYFVVNFIVCVVYTWKSRLAEAQETHVILLLSSV